MSRPADQEPNRRQRRALLISALLVAASGLGYELVGGAVSTYLQGDGVLQFCIVIGTFLSAMGIGSLLSRTVRERLLPTLVWLEISVAVLGSILAPTLLWVYGQGGPYTLALVSIVGAIGVLTGMEIPLLLRLLERRLGFRDLVVQGAFPKMRSTNDCPSAVYRVLFPSPPPRPSGMPGSFGRRRGV